jgi:hypothetical protein
VGASSISVGGATEHVAQIFDNRLSTLEGNVYPWSLNGSVSNTANVKGYGF